MNPSVTERRRAADAKGDGCPRTQENNILRSKLTGEVAKR